jgi:hypothetical protein
VLACVNEGIKAGDVRSDIDPVSAAVSLLGTIYSTAQAWIESGFGFDLLKVFGDRWDDYERMAAAKPSPKSRDAKASSRERAAAYFPLRPSPAPKARGPSAKKGQAAKAESQRKARAPKASKASPKPASRKNAGKAALKKSTSKAK